jgi:thiosulfate/3-mercaptopyruvate sulfurtransferase
MSAARVWWMLRYFGHDAVAVLDGGMPKWKAEGRALEAGTGSPAKVLMPFEPRPRSELLARFEDMMAHVTGGRSQILDARGAARFRGEEGETRPNTRSGHMPGALNLPYGALLASDKTMLSPKALAEKFAHAGLETDRPVVVSCGSGVSSPVLALGLFLTGRPDVVVYDGSWNEWGAHPDAPVVKD